MDVFASGLGERTYGRGDFLVIPAVGRFAVPVFEFERFRRGPSESEERGDFERYPVEGSVTAESSGGRGVRTVERFEVFVSERVDGEGWHVVVGCPESTDERTFDKPVFIFLEVS